MTEETTPVVIELPKELAELKNSVTGLSVDKADKILMAFAPSMTRLTELSIEMEKINFNTPTDFDAEVAGSLRKKLVKVRTGASDEKDSQKELIKIEDKLIMSSFNMIKSACELKENRLREVEDFRAKELARLQAIKLEERKALLEPFNSAFDPITLGAMSDDVFNNYLTGVKANFEAQKEAERKAEEERKDQERITLLHGERKNKLIPFWNFLNEEAKILNFGNLTEEDFQFLFRNTEAKKIADDETREKERAEAARLKKEREEIEAKAEAERLAAERKLQAERLAAQKEKEAAELKAKKERQELEAKLAAERAEIARIEAERVKKEQAEQKAKEAAEKAAKLAEKKAQAAPDKEKLQVFLQTINQLAVPSLKTDEGKQASASISAAISRLREVIEMEISKL